MKGTARVAVVDLAMQSAKICIGKLSVPAEGIGTIVLWPSRERFGGNDYAYVVAPIGSVKLNNFYVAEVRDFAVHL